MKKYLLIVALAVTCTTFAQDETVKKLSAEARRSIKKDPADTLQKKWKQGGVFNLNLAQGSLRNWAAGGDDFSLTITSLLSLYGFYKEGRHSWDNTLDMNFGYVNTTSLGARKNDDRVDLLSKYGYAVAPKWNLATLFNLRSQMLKGYTYPDDVKTFSSSFLSPAYVLLSAGTDFKPNTGFSLYMSPVTARWIIVKDDSLAAKGLYGVEPGENSEVEIGAFLSAQYLKAFNQVWTYKSRLDLYSNYENNPKNVDVFMTNVLTAKLTGALSASWNVDLIYDDDVRLFGSEGASPALQLKSIVGIGLLVKF